MGAQQDRSSSPELATDVAVDTDAVSDGIVVVRVAGSLDLLTSPAMAAGIDAAMVPSNTGVIVDLTGVEFLGSAGLSVLVDAAKRADAGGCRLVIVADGHPVLHALTVTGLDAIFQVCADQDAALSVLTADSGNSGSSGSANGSDGSASAEPAADR